MTVTAIAGSQADSVIDERTSETGPFRRRIIPESLVLEAATLMGRAFGGNRLAMLRLEEALASDNFRAAAFEVLDRELMERYQDLPQTWSQYARRTTTRDFKKKKLVDLMGGRAALDAVEELAEYPARSISKALYEIFVTKFGGRFQISWEAMVNDELDQLSDLPGNLAIAAGDTESRAAASLLTDGSGPNDAYFSATAWGRTYNETTGVWSGGSSNLLSGNPALTVQSLSDALAAISQRKDPEGRPIQVSAYVLVVPPALEVQANIILNASEIEITEGTKKIKVTNWLRGKVRIVVEPWLAVLDLGANVNTTWYLVPDPKSSRPALYVAFLRGHEVPDLRVKADAGQRVGGGDVPAEEGSFDVDDIQYRVRHVVGKVGTDMIASAASNGSGS